MSSMEVASVQIVLLEMQPLTVASVRTVPQDVLRRATSAVRRMAEALHIPLLASAVPVGSAPPRLIDELASWDPAVRRTITPFGDDAQRAWLDASGRRVLALGGVSSEIAVANTAIDARRHGFDVHVLLDCCGGLSERTEAAALRRMEIAGAIPSSVSTFFTALIDDMTTPAGDAVMQALARLWGWEAA